jgi:hypothetical protein
MGKASAETSMKPILPAAVAAIVLLGHHANTQSARAEEVRAGTTKDAVIKDVLVVHQRSQNLGNNDLYLADCGGRFVARNGDIIIASKAPDWAIVVCARQRNTGYTMSAAEGKKSSLGLLAGSVSSSQGKASPSDRRLFGLTITDVVSVADIHNRASHDSPIFQDRATKMVLDTTMKIASPCKIGPQLQAFLTWIYNMGSFKGVPLESKTRYMDGTSLMTYTTTSIEHVSKPASFFAYPTGFKKAESLLDVMLQEGYVDTLEDLWGTVPKKAK